jgi:hypothetical protein
MADSNPRLEKVIDAARRGTRVRLLLDSFFDEEEALRSNRATADYLAAVATAQGLDIKARLGNPTNGGLHVKLVLLHLGAAAAQRQPRGVGRRQIRVGERRPIKRRAWCKLAGSSVSWRCCWREEAGKGGALPG